MRRIEGNEFEKIKPYFSRAAEVAQGATCTRAKCGSVIVCSDEIIGEGFNSPVLGNEDQRMCDVKFDTGVKPKYDKTCCVHAEWRAVLEACKTNAAKIPGSILYFMRIDSDGNFTDAGEPFCTVCSRLTMEAGVGEFALYNDGGADVYELAEYNLKSYEPYITKASSQ